MFFTPFSKTAPKTSKTCFFTPSQKTVQKNKKQKEEQLF